MMSHTIELSDEQYAAILRAVAARPGATVEVLVAEWAEAMDPREPDHYYEDIDEMFRALGASEEVIAEGDRIFRERQAQDEAEEALRDRMREPRCYETNAWLRRLGVSDEDIEASNQRVAKQLAGEDADV